MTDGAEAVFDAVAAAATEVRAGLPERRHYTGEQNPSGETVLAADAFADKLLSDRLTALDAVGAYASEERDEVIDAGTGLSVTCDPLDGSSNLPTGNVVGTVVGVYDAPLPARGRDLVAAGYVLYGPVTTVVVARDDVTEYRLTDDGRERVGDVRLPSEPTVYGFGGRVGDWDPSFRAFVREIESAADLKLRYGGAMVGDVNQVLTRGGVFGYPAVDGAPDGKLRLQFEGNPVAYVVETAGGASSDGDGSILDRPAERLHGRTPVFVGNEATVARLESAVE